MVLEEVVYLEEQLKEVPLEQKSVACLAMLVEELQRQEEAKEVGEILVDREMAAEVPCPSEDYPVVAFRAAFHLKDGASQMEDGLMPVVVAGDKTSSVNLQNFDALSFSAHFQFLGELY